MYEACESDILSEACLYSYQVADDPKAIYDAENYVAPPEEEVIEVVEEEEKKDETEPVVDPAQGDGDEGTDVDGEEGQTDGELREDDDEED